MGSGSGSGATSIRFAWAVVVGALILTSGCQADGDGRAAGPTSPVPIGSVAPNRSTPAPSPSTGAASGTPAAPSSTDTRSAPGSASAGAGGSSTPDSRSQGPQTDVLEIASASRDLSTFEAAVRASGLVRDLEGAGPLTVFAPTDAAFAALPAGVVNALFQPDNRDALAELVAYHLVPTTADVPTLARGPQKTLQGASVTVAAGPRPTVNGASIELPGKEAANGVVLRIDTVLVPPGMDLPRS